MIEDRIGELRVRLRTDLSEAGEVGRHAEGIARAVLESCAALLESRAPGRVILLRRLPLRWRLDEAALAESATVEDLARAAADSLERGAVPFPLGREPEEAEVLAFEDEAHLRAAHLLAAARARPEWLLRLMADIGDPLAALAAPQARDVARSALIRLAQAGILGEVLAAQPAAAVAVLGAALGLAAPRGGAAGSGTAAEDWKAPSPHMMAALRETLAEWPPLDAAVRRIGLRLQAAATLGVDPADSAAEALAAAVEGAADTAQCAPVAVGSRPAPPTATPESARIRTAAGFRDEMAPAEGESGEAADAAGPRLVETRCAGLFYLFDRVQELDLAESLWKACLFEGDILAAAAAALLGPGYADDPAPALFGGVGAIGCPDVSAEQHAEIAAATCTGLAAALPRRGLAGMPAVVVSRRAHPAGRLLVAAADGMPFAFFAWPADTEPSLRAGLRVLLESWPEGTAIAATPDLAALDASGRLRPCRETGPPPLLPAAPSGPEAALLALTAGAPCTLFAARAGTAHASAEAFVAAHLARPGQIRLTADGMRIVLDIADIDLAVRRAGLDRDPGWLPWLRRDVRFVFAERRGTP